MRFCPQKIYHKNLILSEFFSKEIEFTIVQFAHRLFRVLSANSKLLLSTLSLQQVNQREGD